jgi:hypothetical protein
VPRSPLNCEMTGAQSGRTGGIAIPAEVRELLESPNYLHLATLQADGSPRTAASTRSELARQERKTQ